MSATPSDGKRPVRSSSIVYGVVVGDTDAPSEVDPSAFEPA